MTVQESLQVRVLLFAAFREALGTGKLELELPCGSTIDDLYVALERREPRLEAMRPFATFALNREVAAKNANLHDGDEIAVLQPVSGGGW